MARVGVAGDKLKTNQISAEALYLTADPARAEDTVFFGLLSKNIIFFEASRANMCT